MTRFLALLATVAAIAGLVLGIVATTPDRTVLFAGYAGIGAYLAWRPSASRIGHLLVLAGIAMTLASVRVPVEAYAIAGGSTSPADAFLGWANSSGWALGFPTFVALALVFPSGRMPAGRKGWIARAILAYAATAGFLIAFGPVINIQVPGTVDGIFVRNPYGVVPPDLFGVAAPDITSGLYASMFGAFILALGLLVARFRRSIGLERLQYRWLVAAILFAAALNALWVIATFGLQQDANGPANTLNAAGYGTLPIAVAIAVLRYRLYAIDRIISRTLGWLIVTGILAAVFTGAIIGLQALLASFTGTDTLVVAASTLLASALFQPLRWRVQRAVDRRFDRSRIDAARTTEALAARLRDDVDLRSIAGEVGATVAASLAPRQLGLWLRAGDR